jgi:hypothetical protein
MPRFRLYSEPRAAAQTRSRGISERALHGSSTVFGARGTVTRQSASAYRPRSLAIIECGVITRPRARSHRDLGNVSPGRPRRLDGHRTVTTTAPNSVGHNRTADKEYRAKCLDL